MYDQVVKCQRAGLCLSEHFLINMAATCQKSHVQNGVVQIPKFDTNPNPMPIRFGHNRSDK